MFESSRIWVFAVADVEVGRPENTVAAAAESAGLGGSAIEASLSVGGVGKIADFLQEESPEKLFDGIAVVEWPEDGGAWPATNERLRNLGGLWRLMLLFPEVYWIFIVGSNGSDQGDDAVAVDGWEEWGAEFRRVHIVERRCESQETIGRVEQLLLHHASGFRSLFDPSGVRRRLCGQIPAGRGLAIEDEPSYCLLNGYFLFRRCLATSVAATGKEFNRQLRELQGGNPGEWCLVEDVELNFSDTGVALAQDQAICEREDEDTAQMLLRRADFWGLNGCRCRILVTGLDIELRDLFHESQPRNVTIKRKPYSGFYDDVLERTLEQALAEKCGREMFAKGGSSPHSPHSPLAPNQEVALRLLQRGRRVSPRGCSLLAGICGAVMMKTAEELLGGRPVHLAGEATIAKHEFEVASESGWVGITASPTAATVAKRYKGLETEIASLVDGALKARRESRGHGRRLRANLMLHACNSMRRIFDAANRRTEEEYFLRKYRKWYRVEWSQRVEVPNEAVDGRWLHVLVLRWLRQLGNLPLAYLNGLMSGWWALAVWSLFWIATFAAFYQFQVGRLGLVGVDRLDLGFWDWLTHSATVFSGLAAGLEGGLKGGDFLPGGTDCIDPEVLRVVKGLWRATALEVLIGVVHLGVLITLLVQKFLRR